MGLIDSLTLLFCVYGAWVVWQNSKSKTAKIILTAILLYVAASILEGL